MILPFSKEEKKQYYSLLDEVFTSSFWSEGKMVRRFEEEFSNFSGLPGLAFSNGGTALLALFTYADVRGGEVIVPANTFYATALAARMAGGDVVYADCGRGDLCISLADIKRKVTSRTKAVCVVHIGGHVAFEIEEIAAFCGRKGIVLIEDCAHAHGAKFNGKAPGSWGLGGAYSFYATKTLPLGEGGMVSSSDKDFLKWAGYFRNYGKNVVDGKVHYEIANGFNCRMNEMTAALGIVQLGKLPAILSWKKVLAEKYDRIFEKRVRFPPGMVSGYYKYIVFDYDLRMETGKVFNTTDFGPEIERKNRKNIELPNSYWVAEHHRCPPIWFGWEHAEKSISELTEILL